MFQNNNGAIVKRLAKSSLHADKRRNIFIISTIAISVCLMATISLITIGFKQEKINQVAGMYQAAFLDVSQRTIDTLKDDSSLDGAGEYYSISEMRLQDYSVFNIYMDTDFLRLSKSTWEGALPSKPEDIMLERAYLAKINKSAKIGDYISLDIGDGKKEYHITGFFQFELKAADATNYSIIRSKSIVEVDANRFIEHKKRGLPLLVVYIRIANSADLSANSIKNAIYDIANRYDITRKNISISSLYFNAIEPINLSSLLLISGIAIMIGFAAALVVCSIFYISVTTKVRIYGQLRTIGATKKQIKKIVFMEGVHLSSIGIPIGLIAACLLALLIVPKGWNIISTFKCCVAIAIFIFIIVTIAIRRPMKIASATQPIEAIRYTAASDAMNVMKTKQLHRKLSPINMAIITFSRNRKKSTLTLLSLGLSGILLMCAASYHSSLSIEALARGDMFHYGEFQLALTFNDNENADGYAMSRIQQNNPLDETLEKRISAIDGVMGVQVEKAVKVHYTLPDGTRGEDYVSGYSESEAGDINNQLTAGTCDYRQSMNKNGIFVMASSVFHEIYGVEPVIGDKLTFEFYTANGIIEKEYTVLGVMNARIKKGSFLMPVEELQSVAGSNTNIQFSIASDPVKKSKVETELRAIAESIPSFELTTLDNMISEKKTEFQAIFLIIYSIVLVLAFFAIISLINTVVTNILSRKYEFGVLQAIGMSNKQLKQMLQSEGMLYTLGTITVTLTIGTGLGWLLCKGINHYSELHYLDYQFPLIQALLFVAVFLGLQISITAASAHSIIKQSLVELMQQE